MMKIISQLCCALSLFAAVQQAALADSVYSGRLSLDEKAVESITEAVYGTAQNLGNTITAPTPSMSSYEAAARSGNSHAQAMLGGLYYLGDGTTHPNYHLAKQWWDKAAKHNSPIAQLGLGVLYQLGHGVTQSNKTALKWYGKACNNGEQNACDRFYDLKSYEENNNIYIIPIHRTYIY
ncbi:tetratricopeptide repeat protein [Pelistega europaea]|uniref:Sel1 repeat family protein n=1 Tax=Pelistega europaea TaxID=106147 RepID=A0A7Y4L8J3_9BURK|nr:tetratricopeptide repeat protein [Pelistega europaea]NOL48965.1 sel1 repeat family protein [Pelistega europaea]